jgi:hypothetical protein
MNSMFSLTLTRWIAGAFLAAGLAVGGSVGMAEVALADTRSSGGSNSDSQSKNDTKTTKTTKRDRQAQVGLNGNPPHRPVTTRIDQFKHLPFNPALPGGD